MSTTGSPTLGQRRNTAVLGIAAVVLMAVVGLSYREWRRYSRAVANAAQTRAIADSVDRLQASLLDAETGQRGFLLTGEDRYLEPYNRSLNEIPAELSAACRASLQRALASPPTAARLNALTADKLAELRETVELRRTRGIAPPWRLSSATAAYIRWMKSARSATGSATPKSPASSRLPLKGRQPRAQPFWRPSRVPSCFFSCSLSGWSPLQVPIPRRGGDHGPYATG